MGKLVDKPLVCEIPYDSPCDYFTLFSDDSWSQFLDSAQIIPDVSQYSYIAVDPFLTITSKNGLITIDNEEYTDNPFDLIDNYLKQYPLQAQVGYPPLQGGMVGYLGYDCCHHLETLPRSPHDDMMFPDMAVGFYDIIISFDNLAHRSWIFSSGYPELNTTKREHRAKTRLAYIKEKLLCPRKSYVYSNIMVDPDSIVSNFTSTNYMNAVERVIDYIKAGDIFEANISQRFMATLPNDLAPYDLYRRLRYFNPAPFAAYINTPDVVIASASPERFLLLNDGIVESRPIKGTRPRGKTADEDKQLAEALMASEKDWAENVMIVDLMRNDISKVCTDESVNVTQLCGLESFATVHHLVSVVKGKLQKDKTAIDLLKATFPGGSITGAPKIRTMEIIAELEPTQRGPYCGSICYISFDGSMDSSILIRTFSIKNSRATFQAGGAIVLDSKPADEYQETLDKAYALRRSLIDVVNKE